MTYTLTDEQVAAVEAVKTGGSVAIEALAGAGKTSTLIHVAQALEEQGKRGMYISFSKAIVTEAEEKFPSSVECRTAHSLAFRTVGKKYSKRLRTRRLKSTEIARILGIDEPVILEDDEETFTLRPGWVASYVMQAIGKFCMSGDTEIKPRHFPRNDRIDPRNEWTLNDELRDECMPYALKAWEDIKDINGRLRFEHNYYLKLFSLGNPVIKADYLLVDEAQDLNPAMAAIVDYNRERLQVIVVGDSNQAIYAWNGAVDYLGENEFDIRTVLTRSFRFGAEIAGEANVILDRIGCPSKVEGVGREGWVGQVPPEATFLARTNSGVLGYALGMIAQGLRPHIVGGAQDLINFCRGALDLQEGRHAKHPDLAAFDDWYEVVRYVEEDDLGADLKTLVNIVEKHGADRLIHTLESLPSEANADAICSTAHKSKGREWDYVRLGSDFPVGEDVSKEELKLMYVAVTRAQVAIDIDWVDVDGVAARAKGVSWLDPGNPEPADRPTPEEWDVPCPYCGVGVGSPCRTRTGGDMRFDYIHKARKKIEVEEEAA